MALCCRDLEKTGPCCEDRNGGRYRNPCCPRSMAFAVTSPCTDVGCPPNSRSTKVRCCISTNFRKFYHRGDLPVKVDTGRKIVWLTPIDALDYNYYLPVFFDGLIELEHPYDLLATKGAIEMIEASDGCKVLPVLHRLILPMKNALCTRNCKIMLRVLKLIQLMLVKEADLGPALIPYYRHLLGILNIFINKNLNIGDQIDYGSRDNLGDVISQTLEMLERCGGDEAYINIKYIIPTYQSYLA